MSTRFLLAVFLAPAVLAAQIEIAVVDSSGATVPDPYAAIVSADASWRSPLAEKSGTPLRFDVPAGTYRLVAGAPGYATEWRETFHVPAETARVTLQPLASVSGRVVDPEGKPVANARIASYFDRLPDHPRQLSALAERHLQANHLATSDANGSFELHVPASRETVLLFEAERMAPRVVDGVSAGSNRVSEIVLQRGASLALQLDAPADTRVELIPLRAALDASLPEHRAIRLWRRRATDASWNSLPAGTYDVAIRHRASDDPVVVTRVELSEGSARSVTVPSQPAPKGTAVIVAEHDRTLAVTRWRDGVSAEASFTMPEAKRIALADCRPDDFFLLTTQARVGSVHIERCDGVPVTAAMHERASLSIRFEAGVSGGVMTAAACEESTLRMEVPFTAEHRVALVPFPAGCSAITIAAAGFRRMDAGTVRVATGRIHTMTVRDPGRAASLLVRVRDSERLPASGIRVAVVDPEPVRDVRSLDALSRIPRKAEATTDTKGWARFRTLGNEPVQLIAWSADGHVAHLSGAFPLTIGDERIEQLDLDLPGSVRVDVHRDADTEGVELLGVTLQPGPGSLWPRLLALRAPAGAEGARFESVPAGTWIARSEARVRGGYVQNIGRAEVHVQPGAPVTATLSFAGMVYRGRIAGGRNPVTDGVLYLERSGGGSKGNQPATIENGRFSVLLEEPGRFRVSIQRRDGSRIAVAEPVTFESASKESIIRLGDAQIAGTVESADGKPVSGMRIDARRGGDDSGIAQARSDANGRFSLDELSAGTWTLVATNEREQSDEVTIDALAGQSTEGIRLVVRALHRLRGSVVHANGTPAMHAALLVRDGAFGDSAVTAMANERGEFELRHATPLAGKVVNVFVRLGEGGGFARRITLSEGMTLTAPLTGTVRLRRIDAPWRQDTTTDHFLVADDGAWVHPLNVGRVEGDRLVATLAAGIWRYVVISGPEQRAILRSGGGASLPRQRPFVVQESATNEIEIDLTTLRKETR